jgi:hypothetical protein
MSQKTKNIKTKQDKLTEILQQSGLALMTVAATVGMVELPAHPEKRAVIVPNAPAYAVATDNSGEQNPLRREREETGPHYISYSVAQRTPGRTGRA